MSATWPVRLCGEGALPETTCAIVLLRVEPAQFHLGLGRGRTPRERVLHLAWHRLLRDQELDQAIRTRDGQLPAAHIALSLDPLVDEALRVLADKVATRYANQRDSLAYGFGEVTVTFEKTSGTLGDPSAAFTCATFVLAMLRSVGVVLLDAHRWRAPTEEDLRWQQKIGKKLVEWVELHVHGELATVEQRVEKDMGSRRYRPTDVAGAALLPSKDRPLGEEQVGPRALELEAILVEP